MSYNEFTASKAFSDIRFDDRVSKDLKYCLYCYVHSSRPSDVFGPNNHSISHSFKNPKYEIELNFLTSWAKQCPACKMIYIIDDLSTDNL